jgi:predicted RNase H-like HicB family nuclease
MRTLQVVIEKADNNYSAYIDGVDGVIAVGKTIDEIKENMTKSIDALKAECKEQGCGIPEELSGDYELLFKIDMNHY